MINTILLYDNHDATLGTFFNLCANKFLYLHNSVYNQSISAQHNSENCKKETIESVLPAYNNSKFLFACFLHGNEDAMYISNEEIVSANNAYFFTNAFCYTFSFCCCINLAKILLQNNACVFWGYVDKVYSMPDYEEDFAELAISGLKHFFVNKTVGIAYNFVIKEYTDKIDALYKTDFFAASTLLHNRDSLVVCGNTDISIADLTIKK